jgi:hypothetical protein
METLFRAKYGHYIKCIWLCPLRKNKFIKTLSEKIKFSSYELIRCIVLPFDVHHLYFLSDVHNMRSEFIKTKPLIELK